MHQKSRKLRFQANEVSKPAPRLHSQSRAQSTDRLGSRDREQNESGSTTCPVEFIESLCACHSASIIYLLSEVIKSWQRQVMTQEAQTNIESPKK